MDYLKWANDFFSKDIYATETTGIRILVAEENHAKCELPITPKLLNASNTVMGGALFTLADFTFAIAANAGQPQTVSLTSQITYLNVAKGTTLYADATCLKSGKSTCSGNVLITDDMGITVASVTATGFRKQQKLSPM